MFTPPPAHDPPAALVHSGKCVPVKEPRLKALGRGRRLIALVVPVVIWVLISLASRRMAHDPSTDHPPSTAPAPHHLARGRTALKARHHPPRQVGDPADQVPTLAPTVTATSLAPGVTGPQQLGAGAAATAVPSIPVPPYPVPTPFPQPFDSSLAYNFTTTTCSSFFTDFTTNITFRACRPFSLLLGTSSTFFDIQSNLTELTAAMGGTCDTPQTIDQCRATMGWLAGEIVKPTVCGTEIAAQNAMVLEALNGFKTYDLMRQAGCLVNQRSNACCFVEAVASTSPSDTYFYALPLGTPVPPKSTPSCSACIKSLMALYANYATDTTLPLAKSYPSAQKLASSSCGADYAVAVANGASRRIAGGSSWVLGTSLGLFFGTLSLFL
ncbi:transporter protein Sec23 [Ceratobasidium sp. AG-Ba]|nr:transporter protein Sec23 [Ceratobasidium sp. AG-Ba]